MLDGSARPRYRTPSQNCGVDPAAECALDDDWFGDGTVQITERHLMLLRQA